MKYAYYPGCSSKGTGLELDISGREVAKWLGIQMEEIPDWNCCGASSAHASDANLALALPARNLAIAEAQGMPLAIPCAACFLRCKVSEHAVRSSAKKRETVEYLIGRKYEGKYTAQSLLDVFLKEVTLDGFIARTKNPLKGLKVAAYYGCLMVRPSEITQFDDAENPTSMDELVKAMGGENVEWNSKVQCCGASYPTAQPKLGLDMTQSILDDAKTSGADCIICGCPLCVTNLDMRQQKLGKKSNKEYDIPVLYFTELIGIALGISPKDLGIKHHFVDAIPLLKEKNLLKGGK